MMRMTCRHEIIAGLAGLVIACSPAVAAGQAGSGTRAAMSEAAGLPDPDRPAGPKAEAGEDEGLLPGRAMLQLRPRYLYAKQANKPEKAEAYDVRSLVGYKTKPVGDFEFTGQLVNVNWLEPKHASNDPANFASRYPLVADPDKSDVNLLHADYTGVPDFRIRLGRQAISLDNERFISNVDVRQMPQVFDAISVRNTSFPDTELFAAHAWHVRTVLGERVRTNTTLLNARIQYEIGLSAGAYAYFQDQAQIGINTGFGNNSNRIAGARLEGNTPASSGLRWYYTAEVANQRPHAEGDQRIRASYHRLAIGPSWESYSAQLNYERLGSNGGRYGFQMPLSYNTFQGWAYRFFSTPPEGIRDLNASIASRLGRVDLALKHHWFKEDFGGAKQGTEWNLSIGYPINESLKVRAVFTRFRAASGAVRPPGASAPVASADRHYVTLQYDY